MRKLLSLLAAFTMIGFMMSCSDDDDDTPVFDDPTITAPGAQTVTVGGTITVDFAVTVPAGFASSAISAESGGTATIASDLTAGDTGGTISVEFTAGAAAGAGSFTLTVTDQQATPQSVAATAVVNISASAVPTIEGIPNSATIVDGQTLTVPDVVLTADDGFATANAFTVNGADLSALITGASPQTVTITADATTLASLGADGPGSYDLVFELTDADGDVASFTHVLTIEAVSFFAEYEIIDDNGTEDDASDDVVFLEVSGSINSNYELPTVGPDGQEIAYYVLAGRVKVTNGAMFTIPEGSVLKGREGTGASASALLVARDAMLMADGSATLPIIFTAITDDLTIQDVAGGDYVGTTLGATDNGLWGGVIVLGNAPISASADEVQIEGIPSTDSDGLYGGDDAGDNSGVIDYISIRHGGTNIGQGNEINGLSLGGVGSGTSISNVEVVANQDDGIEWFGGDVDIDGALIWNSGDDSMDTDQDWQGTCSNFLIVTPLGSAFELDGPEGPDSRNDGVHTFDVGTVYAGDQIGFLVDWDDNTNAELTNIYFYGIDEDYYPQPDGDGGTFVGIASFGGDGNGTSSDWEATLGGADTIDEVFGDDADDANIITTVAENANTVGVQNDDNFGWTWPGSNGTLGTLGL